MSKASNNSGRFVWHELVTADPKAVIPFYGELFGWTTAEMDMGPAGKYTLFKSNGKDVAGSVAPPPGGKVPPSWLPYAAVDDIQVAVDTAKAKGGTIMSKVIDVPNIGKFAVIIDPQGGALAAMQEAKTAPELEGAPAVGTFCWDGLSTDDVDAALAFYSAVYGYASVKQDMGPMGPYHLLMRGERQAGGIAGKRMKEQPTAWLSYVVVPDVDAGAKRAESLKGKVIVPPSDIPNIGRFAIVADPQGATLALFKGAPDAKM